MRWVNFSSVTQSSSANKGIRRLTFSSFRVMTQYCANENIFAVRADNCFVEKSIIANQNCNRILKK